MVGFGLSVGRQTRQASNEVLDVLQARDVMGLGAVAVSSAGGVLVSQEVAERVLPALGMNARPQSATGFVASAGVKGATAAGLGAVAARMSGLPMLVLAFSGVGALANAGADLFNAAQAGGAIPGSMPKNVSEARQAAAQAASAGGTGNASSPRRAAARGGFDY